MAKTVKFTTIFDVEREQIGGVYARALLNATEKAGNTDAVLQEFDAFIQEVLDQLPRLENTLAAPRVSVESKYAMLDRMAKDKVTDTFLHFLKVVAKHRRLDCLRAIHRAVHERFNEITGYVDVRLMTVEPVDDELRQRVGERLQSLLGRKVRVKAEVNPAIIGGIVVRVGDTVYDASIFNRLDRLKEETVLRASEAIRTQGGFGIEQETGET